MVVIVLMLGWRVEHLRSPGMVYNVGWGSGMVDYVGRINGVVDYMREVSGIVWIS